MFEPHCAQLQAENGPSPQLLGVEIACDLRGLLFETRVKQRFCNASDVHVEVSYTFPLPWGAALMGVDVLLGDKRLSGSVVDKAQAEDEYETALSDGNSAIMLEKNHDDSYTLNLGNLAAGEKCTISLHYAQSLQFEQGSLRLMIPTVIAPRYGNPWDAGLQPHQVPEHSILAEHPFDLQLRLHGGLARAGVASPSHPIAVAPAQGAEPGPTTVSLARQGFLDRDFILVLDPLPQTSLAVAAADYADKNQVAVLASFCPQLPDAKPLPVGLKILVDCSGSMAGDSIEAARRALHGIMAQLDDGERFSLSRFGSSVEHRSRRLWKVSPASLNSAAQWIDGLQADMGGTEMAEALLSSFAQDQSTPADLLLITDGEIHNIDATLQAGVASGQRLFTVGIGSSPAEGLLRRLALATGGACDFVAPGEAVEPAVLRMFKRMRSPQVQQVRIQWPEGAKPIWATRVPRAVFSGDTVNVFALFDTPPQGAVQLLCAGPGPTHAPHTLGMALLPETTEPTDTLSRLAATARIHESVSTTGAPDGAQTALALRYQLITRQTNFLLVHERPAEERPSHMPQQHPIRPMLPAGWGGAGSVMFLRKSESPIASSALGHISHAKAVDTYANKITRNPVYLKVREILRSFTHDSPLAPQPQQADSGQPWYRLETPDYTGLTPLGLHRWLQETPPEHWPTTYAALLGIGLGQAVVNWLAQTLSNGADQAPDENAIVASFVRLMASQPMHEQLMKSVPTHVISTLAPARQALPGHACTTPGADHGMVQHLQAALCQVTATDWTHPVLHSDTRTTAHSHKERSSIEF